MYYCTVIGVCMCGENWNPVGNLSAIPMVWDMFEDVFDGFEACLRTSRGVFVAGFFFRLSWRRELRPWFCEKKKDEGGVQSNLVDAMMLAGRRARSLCGGLISKLNALATLISRFRDTREIG